MIIDAHVHLPCYDDSLITLNEKKSRLLNDLIIAGVDGAIVIADSEMSSTIGTPKECVELFADIQNINVIGGISPLIDYETRLNQLDEFLHNKSIVGCKLYPGHESYYMNDTRLTDVFHRGEVDVFTVLQTFFTVPTISFINGVSILSDSLRNNKRP